MSRVSHFQVMLYGLKNYTKTNTGWDRTSAGNMERHFYSVKSLTLENPIPWSGI